MNSIEIAQILFNLKQLAFAYVLALPIGWDRERHERSAGLRTFPLVAIASCGFVLATHNILDGHPEGRARIVEGIVSGVGFIGGGAILKSNGRVSGTATAASIWSTGAMGVAVAFGSYEVAIVLSIINFLTLRFLAPLKHQKTLPGAGEDEN